jgi:hypothetical protein
MTLKQAFPSKSIYELSKKIVDLPVLPITEKYSDGIAQSTLHMLSKEPQARLSLSMIEQIFTSKFSMEFGLTQIVLLKRQLEFEQRKNTELLKELQAKSEDITQLQDQLH